MVVLEVRGVDCYYGSVKVLENIHFSVKKGDFVGILGPNGSGKTTLLKSISRTLEPKTGTIRLNDENIYSMKSVEVARNLAVVPQETAVAFDFTALDIVFMGRNPHISRFKMESTKDLAIAKKAMELTNTWYLAERPINELSGGEKQRVIIARALTQEPKVLLLDEPTTHLDINNQLEIMDLLEKLCKDEGLTLIAVIHDFNLATRYCDSAILLNNGSIFSIGTIDNVLTCDNIRKVFNVDMIVKRHPITDLIYVIPLYISKSKVLQSKNMVVHVISGHGTGTSLMKLLLEQGYSVTSGVLSSLDTDYDAACALGIPVVSEAPFSPITEENHEANISMIEEANVVIVTDVPFGQGNLKNLEAVKAALEKKKTTIIFEKKPIQQRDFTKGKAQKLFEDLKDKGAIVVKEYKEAFSILEASKTRE